MVVVMLTTIERHSSIAMNADKPLLKMPVFMSEILLWAKEKTHRFTGASG